MAVKCCFQFALRSKLVAQRDNMSRIRFTAGELRWGWGHLSTWITARDRAKSAVVLSVSARGGLPEEVNSAGVLKSLMLMMEQNLKFCLGLPFRYQP